MIKLFCDGCGNEVKIDGSVPETNRGGQQVVEWTIGDHDFRVGYTIGKKNTQQRGYEICHELCWTCLHTIMKAGDYASNRKHLKSTTA